LQQFSGGAPNEETEEEDDDEEDSVDDDEDDDLHPDEESQDHNDTPVPQQLHHCQRKEGSGQPKKIHGRLGPCLE
jgi:hypothetical protein